MLKTSWISINKTLSSPLEVHFKDKDVVSNKLSCKSQCKTTEAVFCALPICSLKVMLTICTTNCRTAWLVWLFMPRKQLLKISETSAHACVCLCACTFYPSNAPGRPSNHFCKAVWLLVCHRYWWNQLSVTRFKFHTDLESANTALRKAGFYGNATTECGNLVKKSTSSWNRL